MAGMAARSGADPCLGPLGPKNRNPLPSSASVVDTVDDGHSWITRSSLEVQPRKRLGPPYMERKILTIDTMLISDHSVHSLKGRVN